ncbi:MAG: hypothetical protein ACKPKO_06060, partial [Candidatus Fonsibacter sp.]
MTLRTRALRHEFLQGLINKGALQLEQVIFGGRLPDRLQQPGVLDDDQEHFRKLMLGKAEVQAHLNNHRPRSPRNGTRKQTCENTTTG